MNGFTFRLISGEHGLCSCSLEEIPDNYKKQFVEAGTDMQHLTIFYFKERDLLVLNEDNKHFESYKNIAVSYLQFDKADREHILHHTVNSVIYAFMFLLECIVEYRAI